VKGRKVVTSLETGVLKLRRIRKKTILKNAIYIVDIHHVMLSCSETRKVQKRNFKIMSN